MQEPKISELQEVVESIKFDAKKNRFNKAEKNFVVRITLKNGKSCEIPARKTTVDLLNTLKECGIEKPIKSFQVEKLPKTDGVGDYHAIVCRVNSKRGSAEVYMIPFDFQEIMELLLDKLKSERKGGK